MKVAGSGTEDVAPGDNVTGFVTCQLRGGIITSVSEGAGAVGTLIIKVRCVEARCRDIPRYAITVLKLPGAHAGKADLYVVVAVADGVVPWAALLIVTFETAPTTVGAENTKLDRAGVPL